MRLRCTNGMTTHWATFYEEGKEYDVVTIEEKKVTFVTDYDSVQLMRHMVRQIHKVFQTHRLNVEISSTKQQVMLRGNL